MPRFLILSSIVSNSPIPSPFRTSIPRATLCIFAVLSNVSFANLSNRATGRLSTQKYPISSNVFNALLFPAPDIPVTITNLICSSSLETSNSFHFRLHINTELFFYFLLYICNQLHNICCSCIFLIDHKTTVFV